MTDARAAGTGMASRTRCPACGSVFRLKGPQLQASGGWARCGVCREAFDASRHLEDAPFDQGPAGADTNPEPPPSGVSAEAGPDTLVPATSALSALDSPRKPNRLRRALAMSAAAALLLALPLQVLYLTPAALVDRWPASRPALLALCESLGCRIPLPALTDRLIIDASDLQAPDGARSGELLFTASLRNTAPHPQTHPSLRLTLTDPSDRAVATLVLDPESYLPPAEPPERAMAPGATTEVRLRVDAGDLTVAGFRLDLIHGSRPR